MRIADRYLLRLMAPRMALALVVALAALMLERLLRLMDFAAANGLPLGQVLAMAANLIPHYLGLALPAAFCFAVIGALSRMASGNELDALEGAGWSLRRIAAPVIVCAAVMSLASVLLFGFAQPHGRYAYNETRERLLAAGWDGQVEQGVFIRVGDGLLLHAKDVTGGRLLRDVVVLRKEGVEGAEEKGDGGLSGWSGVRADSGAVVSDPKSRQLHLMLEDGQMLRPDGKRVDFESLVIGRDIGAAVDGARSRGESERELTFTELWEEMRTPGSEPRFATELHDRLVRVVSIFGVALLAAPLAVSRKGTPSWPRIAVAVAILAIYDNALKSASAMADLGRVDPAVALWGLALVFNGAGLWLYLTTPSQASDGPWLRLRRVVLSPRGPSVPAPAGPTP